MNLENKEFQQVRAARNTPKWDEVCASIKAAHGGELPDDWFQRLDLARQGDPEESDLIEVDRAPLTPDLVAQAPSVTSQAIDLQDQLGDELRAALKQDPLSQAPETMMLQARYDLSCTLLSKSLKPLLAATARVRGTEVHESRLTQRNGTKWTTLFDIAFLGREPGSALIPYNERRLREAEARVLSQAAFYPSQEAWGDEVALFQRGLEMHANVTRKNNTQPELDPVDKSTLRAGRSNSGPIPTP